MLSQMSRRTKIILTILLLTVLFVDFYFDRRPVWRAQVTRIVIIGIELEAVRR